MSNSLVSILAIFLVLIGVFLLCREVVCWYFKINKRTELLTKQNELQQEMNFILLDIAEELKNN